MGLGENFISTWSYEFRGLLDSGGSADALLYSRRMPGLPDQEVVLKVLRGPESDLAELLNEGKKLSELRHRNIVSTFGYEKLGPSRFALVLEYVRGRNLRDVLPLLKSCDRMDVAAHVIRLVAEAISVAHVQKIVHGDISARNVLVSETAQIKLSDFGEATKLGSEVKSPQQKASLDYLAPERWMGGPPSKASDIFALGVLAFEIISGTNPLRGLSATQTKARLEEFLKNQPWLAYKSWIPFFLKTLHSDPADRGSASELMALVPILGDGHSKLASYLKGSELHLKRYGRGTSTLVLSFRPWRFLEKLSWSVFAILILFNTFSSGISGDRVMRPMKMSSITVTSSPWGEVLIDGVSMGYTPLLDVHLKAGFHRFIWRDASGAIVRRTIMDYGNALFAYKILRSRDRLLEVLPLVDAKEALEP
jgi:serine/threonine protein kinase